MLSYAGGGSAYSRERMFFKDILRGSFSLFQETTLDDAVCIAALSRHEKIGVPRPDAGSHPFVAPYRFLPPVISWKH